MAKLIYAPIASIDGYIEDVDGGFGWAEPGDEAHAFINDLERPVGTYLYGRRMYETMVAWETDSELTTGSEIANDFAQIWRAADKVVYSRTLEAASTGRTRIEREFDPAAVQQLKDAASADLAVGGPDLAAQAFGAGLVDECHLFLAPVIVGGGKRALPAKVQLALELVGERRFGDGMVFLQYRARPR